jgi:hypothetical protein
MGISPEEGRGRGVILDCEPPAGGHIRGSGSHFIGWVYEYASHLFRIWEHDWTAPCTVVVVPLRHRLVA